MKNISLRIWATDMYCVITMLLSKGTSQGSTDIHVCLFMIQIQLRYIYLLLSHHHSPTINYDIAILNTFLSTNFGANLIGRSIEQKGSSSKTGMELESYNVQQNMPNIGQTTDRSVCHKTKYKITIIHSK